MIKVITAWTIAAIVYVSYATLAIGPSSSATHVWVALLFTILSIGAWGYIHYRNNNTRKKRK